MNKIPFNIPLVSNSEIKNITRVLDVGKFSGDGEFTKKCNYWLENLTKSKKALLTTSCTHALELSATLINIQPGDESRANSFAASG